MADSVKSILNEGPVAEARLNRLGLTHEELVAAVTAAELERRSCSPLEPSNSPGFKSWAAAFRTLAEPLTNRGWLKSESHGLPRIVNPETRVAVAVLTGDDDVGVPDGSPLSRSPRGPQSILLVRSNQRQLQLFPNDERFKRTPPAEEQMTWWLLIYSNEFGALRAELALPVGLDDENRLSIWKERILLEVQPLADTTGRDSEADETPLEIKVNVRPRT